MRKSEKYCSMNKKRTRWILMGAFCFMMLSILLSLCFGTAVLTFRDLTDAVINGPQGGVSGRIFWYARLPRTAASLLAGAGLAVSGTVIQNVLNNKLASPGIIGVNAGAGLAVTICCAIGTFSGWIMAGAAFSGAMLAVFLVTFTARKIGASRTTVILGGVAVNSLLNAACEAITTLIPDAGVQSADFRVGGFSAVAYTRLIPAGILILAGILLMLTLCNELDILALGEETAQGLGMSVKKMRTLFLVIAAMLAGAAVSFSGLLGFVGLIIPHLGRKLVGSESESLVPFCILFGAGFVTFCDLISRVIFSPYEIPAGILMAFIGGPFFLFILMGRKRGGV